MEGDRRLAQTHDHHVASGFDPLGDGDFTFAAEQFDRTHFAQIHAHRIVRAFSGCGLFGSRLGRSLAVLFGVGRDFLDLVRFFSGSLGIFVAFDDLHTHV